MIKGFDKAVSRVKYLIEYGFHCNDLSYREFEEDLCLVFDRLAKENDEPEIDWEYHDET